MNGFEKGKEKLHLVACLPEIINESSGLALLQDSTFLTHNDGGQKPVLFQLNNKFQLIEEHKLQPLKNLDWESVTIDEAGNIYIGDMGNNYNNRKNLRILKLNKDFQLLEEINFSYPNQYAFPPEKENMNFDGEALFYYSGSLFLISKNRGNKIVKLYKLPSVGGTYQAELVDSIKLSGPITDAAIDLQHKEFVLLSYGYVYRFSFQHEINFEKPKSVKYYGRLNQSEGITYSKNGKSLFITNEGGKVFKLN